MEQWLGRRLGASFVAVMLTAASHYLGPAAKPWRRAAQWTIFQRYWSGKWPGFGGMRTHCHRLTDMGQKAAPAGNAREHLADSLAA